jgi:glycerol kinase
MKPRYILALDQGTSSSRSIIFDPSGNIVAMAQQEIRQIYPEPGWVEHNPLELWTSQLATARQALKDAGLKPTDVAVAGITNQRETTLIWDRSSGQPIHNAIVWQDRRAEPTCLALRANGHEQLVQSKTGLRIDPYFSATKLKWILDRVPGSRERARKGELAFGTVDSWLIWNLTCGRRHVTDVSNAARTMLFNITANRWDSDLLDLLDIPIELMPEVLPSSSDFGTIDPVWLGAPLKVGGVAGDQQSASFGQACFHAGMAKNTYGTGCFLLMHTGEQSHWSTNGLLTTAAAQPASQRQYAMEGSVFIGGAVVQWLRDGLQAIPSSSDVQRLAESVPDAGGVVFVPAFTGLGAPYWNADVQGAIVGLTRGSTVAHIARAALESIAFQSAALLQAMNRDSLERGGVAVSELRVDGGACVNDLLMQIQADLLGIPVVRPAVIETTALGAAYLAGLHVGIYQGLDELSRQWRAERTFTPTLSRSEAQERMSRWEHAVRQVQTS